MTVIAFRPRQQVENRGDDANHAPVTGTFQSPRGLTGRMEGILRVETLRPVPGGACVDGVFTAELREADGTLIGVDSRRATVDAAAVRDDLGLRLVVDPLELDLMGLTIRVGRFTVEHPRTALPRGTAGGRPRSPGRRWRERSC